MKLLKLFLYVILSTCILWGATILFGPVLITKLTGYYSNGRVMVKQITVSPRFEVRVGKIDVFPVNDDNGFQLISTARAVNIKLVKLLSDPSIEVSTGFVDVSGIGSIKSSTLSLKLNELYDLNITDFGFDGNHIELLDGLLSEKFFAEGQLNLRQQKASNLKLNFSELSWPDKGRLFVPEITLLIDKYILSQGLKEQSNLVEVRIPKFNLGDQVLLADDIGLKVVQTGGLINFALSVNRLDFKSGEVSANRLVMENDLAIDSLGAEKKALFRVAHLEVPSSDLKMSEVSGVFSGVNQLETLFVKGRLDNYAMSLGKLYVGEINNGEFSLNFDLISDLNSLSVKTDGIVKSTSEPIILLSVKSLSDIFGSNSLSDCLQSNCYFSNLFVDYSLAAGNEKIVGSLKCPNANCFAASSKYSFETQNTSRFFELLSKAKILNPIVLAFLYGEVQKAVETQSGQKFGSD